MRWWVRHALVRGVIEMCRFGVARRFLARQLARELRRIHDILSTTPLDGHYWIWSGLLLGWTREGGIMEHDCDDADFGVMDDDFELLAAAAPVLHKAGFHYYRRFRNNSGATTEVVFTRRGLIFEFFRMYPVADELQYFTYGWLADGPTQLEGYVPLQPKEEFRFVKRTWLKHKDHELELESLYGNWRVPNKDWSYLDDGNYRTSQAWLRTDYRHWDGSF